MTTEPQILEALRLSELIRAVCSDAGMPLPCVPAGGERFVVRTGPEPPAFFVALLEEALDEEGADVALWNEAETPHQAEPATGHVVVRSGFPDPCPDPDGLKQAAAGPKPGRVLLFAIERHDTRGDLLGVTWVALPESEPSPQARFRAAVRHQNNGGIHAL